jgi:hypothetical protein
VWHRSDDFNLEFEIYADRIRDRLVEEQVFPYVAAFSREEIDSECSGKYYQCTSYSICVQEYEMG